MNSKQNHGEQDPAEDKPQRHVIIPFERAKDGQSAPDVPDEVAGGELSRQEIRRIVEALLFAASGPLSTSRLAELAAVQGSLIRSILEELKEEYQKTDRGFGLEEIAGGYQLLSSAELQPWISKLRRKEHQDTLSQAALETLAIIAYRQPITRADIEGIRGVQSGYILRSLIERSLVRVVGRSEELGRPLLYGTTKQFLEAFGLSSLKSLPKLDDLEPSSDHE